jgi:hypothetical protein
MRGLRRQRSSRRNLCSLMNREASTSPSRLASCTIEPLETGFKGETSGHNEIIHWFADVIVTSLFGSIKPAAPATRIPSCFFQNLIEGAPLRP